MVNILKAGKTYHHWRYGPMKAISVDDDYIKLEILGLDGIIMLPNDPWNDVIEKDTTKTFHTKSVSEWLHTSIKALKESPAPTYIDHEQYKKLLHNHYR